MDARRVSAASAWYTAVREAFLSAYLATTRQHPRLLPDDVDAFLSVGRDGIVRVYSGKVDLGTGTRTALRQIAAEELDVRFGQVDLVEGDTALTPDQGPTWGSLTIQIGGLAIRQAAATARRALLVQAAQRLGIATENLEVKDGIVRSKWDRTVSTSYVACE